MSELFMIVGFMLAAYAVIANDSIQTLGTFMHSNRFRPWWVLFAFASTILLLTLVGGWALSHVENVQMVEVEQENGTYEMEPVPQGFDVPFYSSSQPGDPAWARLSDYPEIQRFNWVYIVPPLVLLIITRFGIPVSTSFMVLTFVSATSAAEIMENTRFLQMFFKTVQGYLLAAVAGFVIFVGITNFTERFWRKQPDEKGQLKNWVIAQWCSTGLLWSMWLAQDMANIFVFLPRSISWWGMVLIVIWMVSIQAIIFRERGGRIQEVVRQKSNTGDIRAATIIDLIYGLLLAYKLTVSTVPMSTTWVFVGLLAGRQLGMATAGLFTKDEDDIQFGRSLILAGKDLAKVTFGLIVGVGMAYGLAQFKPEALTSEAEEEATAQVEIVGESEPGFATAGISRLPESQPAD
jgi:hypothetical protein